MKHWLYRTITVCLCFVASIAAMSAASGTVHAASLHDPLVVVVRDVTPPGCQLRNSVLQGGIFVPISTVSCPAGTALAVMHVPLSQAVANHEAYVALPSPSSSLAEQSQVEAQIEALESAADAHYHPHASSPISTASVCATNAFEASVLNGDLSWDKVTTYDMWVDWDVTSNCMVDIYNSELHGVNINSYFYWAYDKYANWQGNAGCRQVSNGWPYWAPNTVHNNGYYYEQYVYNGDHCTAFDTWQYYNLGPLHT